MLNCIHAGKSSDPSLTFCRLLTHTVDPEACNRCTLRKEGNPTLPEGYTPEDEATLKQPLQGSGVGDCLQGRFAVWGFRISETCNCEALRQELNTLEPGQIAEKVEEYVEKIFPNVKEIEGFRGTLARVARALLPGTVKGYIKADLLSCIEEKSKRVE